MTYTLNFHSRFGLWELQINRFRARFYLTRYGAEKVIARYRRMLHSSRIATTTSTTGAASTRAACAPDAEK
jgi:hypothetical protein